MKTELVVAIIAAASALGGVLMSQAISLFQAFVNRRVEERKLLRQKIEQTMRHFSDSLNWFPQLNYSNRLQDILALSYSVHARKAASLCLLYFPDLVAKSKDYISAQSAYHQAVMDALDPDSMKGQYAVVLARINNREAYDKALNILFEKKGAFENSLRAKAREYIHA